MYKPWLPNWNQSEYVNENLTNAEPLFTGFNFSTAKCKMTVPILSNTATTKLHEPVSQEEAWFHWLRSAGPICRLDVTRESHPACAEEIYTLADLEAIVDELFKQTGLDKNLNAPPWDFCVRGYYLESGKEHYARLSQYTALICTTPSTKDPSTYPPEEL
ncbi:hypothetical protein BDQ12DRAFT_668722 [Crucibulum laeve]|uniref:Uncharacterized protein n=1 Tax=Crucibulum laeve TaxID=68775 RepID=A0A5C3LT15_9AGAR|nr:hypothetical protein BDQ12DRAFT_668722 [Crucibulum laeve]